MPPRGSSTDPAWRRSPVSVKVPGHGPETCSVHADEPQDRARRRPTMSEYDLIGYGAAPPRVRWPNDAHACAMALERNPAVGRAITDQVHDVLENGNRYQRVERVA